ncbi:MAG TPA: DinB family protein [Ktedonosporobacter sp.]|nr:DinB family protein [Ktedonosporobacter sp.]
MSTTELSLMSVYEGWDGHQMALVQAVTPLSPEQLASRAAPHLRSAGELIAHIVVGRIGWIHQILGVESDVVDQWIEKWGVEGAAKRFFQDVLKPGVEQNASALVSGLEATWQMIEGALNSWTVDDLRKTLRHDYQGKTYAISRQWILWRIMAHDLHHGGELAFALGIQGISLPELGDQGGHLTEVPLAEQS